MLALFKRTALAQMRKEWQEWSLIQNMLSPHLKGWLYPLVNREGQYFQAQNRGDAIRLFFKKIILEIEFEGSQKR